jgi:hypothetical protein
VGVGSIKNGIVGIVGIVGIYGIRKFSSRGRVTSSDDVSGVSVVRIPYILGGGSVAIDRPRSFPFPLGTSLT